MCLENYVDSHLVVNVMSVHYMPNGKRLRNMLMILKWQFRWRLAQQSHLWWLTTFDIDAADKTKQRIKESFNESNI